MKKICAVILGISILASSVLAESQAVRAVSYEGTFPKAPDIRVILSVTGEPDTSVTVTETIPDGWRSTSSSPKSTVKGSIQSWDVSFTSSAKTKTIKYLLKLVKADASLPSEVVFSGKIGEKEIEGIGKVIPDGITLGMHIPWNTGLYYKYLVYLPKSYQESNKKWPLILFLHSWSERGDNLATVQAFALAGLLNTGSIKTITGQDEFPFIVVSPQAPAADPTWKEAELMKVLEDVFSRYNVDKDRIYATGTSFGGSASWSLGCNYPDIFSAVAPVSAGGAAVSLLPNMVDNVSVWAFHNQNDGVTSINGDIQSVEALQNLGGDAQLTTFPDSGHDAWTKAYKTPDLYSWLLKYHKNTEPAKIGEWQLF